MIVKNASNLGFPRMGKHRELKFTLEKYWSGQASEADLLATARNVRKEHWQLQVGAGIDIPPSNDFSLYDHVLDTTVMVGAVPARARGLQPGTRRLDSLRMVRPRCDL